ncbi:hypothetical protein [Pseudonocardia pini]|uniref:hypothetical protein n=1 Tax=Pseudonocardia pini TaxID=2758030 RepID=UPI0015EFE06E|nr:hypothetical protein [Pseudonocardia pini]
MSAAPDAPAVPTVRSRILAAGVSPERLDQHHREGRVQLDGEPVTDLDMPAPKGTRINFAAA